MTTRLRPLTLAAILAGLAGGAADILMAFVIYRPATPMLILQSVASGLMGPASFEGGWNTATLGLIAHFVIAIIFAAIFIAAALQAPVALRRPVLSGLLFGVTVYGVMNAIVVPLSMSPPRPAPSAPDIIALGLLAHALFGVALSLTAARMLRKTAP
ncbi:hypothetical protein [Brevundimonas sp. Root1423]|uniref:hypothetical protein n=1 Tax=Brevundimonas sp. Root1423 TaxID=1736462 RepID=UPI0006F4EED0|nr:hypothetical protein [Brevundimonas sp. Root1423]KQY84812.1 hypothetical protein ASD25_07280 [Brevundimonas sp. Root1423]